MTLRPATLTDAPAIAALHAESWRFAYRGAYPDAYLDGPSSKTQPALMNPPISCDQPFLKRR